jgi:hypothetical protein
VAAAVPGVTAGRVPAGTAAAVAAAGGEQQEQQQQQDESMEEDLPPTQVPLLIINLKSSETTFVLPVTLITSVQNYDLCLKGQPH